MTRPARLGSLAVVALLLGVTLAQEQAPEPSPAPAPTAPPLSISEVVKLIQSGRLELAVTEIDRSLAGAPTNARLHYLKAFALLGLKRTDEAAAAAGQVLAADPKFEGANVLLARIEEENGQFDAALENYRAELEVARSPSVRRDTLLGMATLHIRLKQLPEAAAALEKVIQVAPDHVGAIQELADLYRRMGRKPEADAMLARATALSARDPQQLYKLGVERHSAGDLEVAAAYLGKALEADPGFADAHRQIAYTLVSLGLKDEAAEHLERYLELAKDPEDPNVQSARKLLEDLKAPKESPPPAAP